MKKDITIIIAAFLALSLTACSGNPDKTPDNKQNTSSVIDSQIYDSDFSAKVPEPEQIEAAIAEALGDGYYCTKTVSEDELTFSCLGRLDLSKIESYVVKQTAIPSVQQDSIVIVKCKSGYADEAVAGFNDYYAQIVSYTEQYPFGVAKINGARIYRVDDTVMYIVAGASPDGDVSSEDEFRLADAEYAKIDKAIMELFGTLPENLAEIPIDPAWHRAINDPDMNC